ncbi:FAD:protein FMN transferase [Schaedlerella sp.]|uniref:FAD:protein FMN transferase n=1 Tax=Schaedlerella sp. TaxID=2676057 RepID=UPI0013640850|nr:FAD:protein FMN transferase [Ruminococcus sp.]MCI9329703.1 FAD:protein FMN transferase [Ruminococcus sp.]NBI98885.1 FAD:protein FMN transferase [Lachnospiraceae bacterium]
MKKVSFFSLIILLLLPLASCSSPRKDEKLSVTGIYFDTVIQIDAWGVSTSVLDECKKICENYESLFSNKVKTSEVSRINASAGTPVKVSQETVDLISLGLRYCELSSGKFDITISPLSDLWNFTNHTEHTVPDAEAIEEARSHVDYRKVLVDKKACTVTLLDPQAKIDLGGIAKGYIADRLKEYLKKEGVEHALINLGGNVLTLGASFDGSPFRIGIQKPFDEQNAPIDILEIQDRSVVSSGVYQRYFKKDGRLYHHILNPETGYPYANQLLQATVITDSSADGDALSTCCFALGLEEGSALIESLKNVQAIFVTEDYRLHYVGY